MNSIHANPVEIIKKDIYIIKNIINGKIYVGQSQNAAIRFKQHCKPCNSDNSVIGKAIKKYGKNNFTMHIIEHQIENYNERERYWIDYYHSIVPFGYNIMSGGETPPVLYGEDSPVCSLSDKDLKLLQDDLSNTNKSYRELSKEYGISKKQVMRINYGLSRASLDVRYPLRKVANKNGKLSINDVELIIDMLKNTYFLNGEIARMFNVDVHAISCINSGKTHRISGESYPIRKWKSCGAILFTYEQVTEIIDLLQNSTMSLNKIAQKYNVYVQPIQEINNGTSKKYRREEVVYPIRNY